jgi:hypothetical protein
MLSAWFGWWRSIVTLGITTVLPSNGTTAVLQVQICAATCANELMHSMYWLNGFQD